MKTKIKIIIGIFILFVSMSFMKDNSKEINNDKEYFSTFRKNETPKDVNFQQIANYKNFSEVDHFYVIFKKDCSGNEFYYKISFNKADKIVNTEVSYINVIEKTIKDKLVDLSNKFIKSYNQSLIAPDDATCVIKCHRENGCYDKPTNEGVLLCSIACQIGCA